MINVIRPHSAVQPVIAATMLLLLQHIFGHLSQDTNASHLVTLVSPSHVDLLLSDAITHRFGNILGATIQ